MALRQAQVVTHLTGARGKGLADHGTPVIVALPSSHDGPQNTVEKEQSDLGLSVRVGQCRIENHGESADPSLLVKKQSAQGKLQPAARVRSRTSRKARPSSRVGHDSREHLIRLADPSSVEKAIEIEKPAGNPSSQPPSADDLFENVTRRQDVIGRLVFSCRVRSQLMSAKNRLSNQIDAMERLRTGVLKKGKPLTKREPTLDDIAVAEATRGHIEPYLKPMEKQLAGVSKEIEGLAAGLHVWPWVTTIRGFGALGLGLIVGSTGDLSKYSTPAKLWKRMGLALVGNERQRRTTDVDLALAMGYNPRRRSLMHNIGDSLIKQNGISGDGYYRDVYDARKVYTESAHPEWTKAHRHMDALRYMQKRLLRHLWQVWKRQAVDSSEQGIMAPTELDSQATDHHVCSLTPGDGHI